MFVWSYKCGGLGFFFVALFLNASIPEIAVAQQDDSKDLEAEIIRNAIEYYIENRHPESVRIADSTGTLQTWHLEPYLSVDHFLSINPDCCRVQPTCCDTSPPNFWARWWYGFYGYAIVEFTYQFRSEDLELLHDDFRTGTRSWIAPYDTSGRMIEELME